MPAKTKKQAKFMRMCAHSPKHSYKKCPSPVIAREFMHAKKGK